MNKKGFTLVELLAVIAILAILVIIALPNVLNMFNQAKKDTFLTEVKTVYKEISKKYITETMRGNKIDSISNSNNKLDLETSGLTYNIKLDSKGNVESFQVSNDTYCISGKFTNLGELTTDKIKEGKCDPVDPVEPDEPKTEPKDPESFETDDWDTIKKAIDDGNDDGYKVGDEKEIDMGVYGKHRVRIANLSIPSECSTTGFSQTACGFVLEFVDVVTTHSMNSNNSNAGSWSSSDMRTFINNDIYNSMPQKLKEMIIPTRTVSGYASGETANSVTENDKLYLLAPKEIYSDWSSTYDSAKDLSRQLDYYKMKAVTISSYTSAVKKNGSTAINWWLRSADSGNINYFFTINTVGNRTVGEANSNYGVSPAFRIG